MEILTIVNGLLQSSIATSSSASSGAGAAAALMSFLFSSVCCILPFVAISIIGIGLWIYFIIDATQRDFGEEKDSEMLWILILFFAGWIGMVVYYFAVMQKYPKKAKA